jgi:hypothetical protein
VEHTGRDAPPIAGAPIHFASRPRSPAGSANRPMQAATIDRGEQPETSDRPASTDALDLALEYLHLPAERKHLSHGIPAAARKGLVTGRG